MPEAAIYVALVHGPVKNKRGERVTTAVTGLNVHDIARAVTTYGGRGYFLVTPLAAQQELVRRMVAHWEGSFGTHYNPNRKDALGVAEVVNSLDDTIAAVAGREGGAAPRVVVTSAREVAGVAPVTFSDLRGRIADGGAPLLLVFGTGWGLVEETIGGADLLLEPIHGHGGYNHLSVRSAVSIVLDRLLGERGERGPE
ncbi:MAG: RNA methyltransferase [Nitrospirota bacterium]|nr:RNA methyltransferase [Nitrospirota bacterium]